MKIGPRFIFIQMATVPRVTIAKTFFFQLNYLSNYVKYEFTTTDLFSSTPK